MILYVLDKLKYISRANCISAYNELKIIVVLTFSIDLTSCICVFSCLHIHSIKEEKCNIKYFIIIKM